MYEQLLHHIPSVTHLTTFDSLVYYILVTTDNLKKWEDEAIKCEFLGYNETTKAYWVYNPMTKCA